jgi:SAM-dependent methyltransferase
VTDGVPADRRHPTLSGISEKAAAAGRMWGGADYERLAERLAPVHDLLVAKLRPQPGVRWLDLATGTGEVAVRAAASGAEVVAIDISEALLAQARAKAPEVDWRLGDLQALPLEDGSFDVVSCCFGVMFPPDSEAVAGELARVCEPGARLGLTTWLPVPRLAEIYREFAREPAGDYDLWGAEAGVRGLLGDAFELDIRKEPWTLDGDSPEALWEFHIRAAPPAKAFLDTLDEDGRAGYREAMLSYWRDFALPDGGVRERRDYLLVLGVRR